jgi:hypothetical protein
MTDPTLIGFQTIQISIDSVVFDARHPKKWVDAKEFRKDWNEAMLTFKKLDYCCDRAIKILTRKGWRITPAKIFCMPNQPYYVHNPEPRHLEV